MRCLGLAIGLGLIGVASLGWGAEPASTRDSLVKEALAWLEASEPSREQRIFLAIDIPESRLIASLGGLAATREIYSPGSLIKPALVWALSRTGRLRPDYRYSCSGRFFPQGKLSSGRGELIHEDVEFPRTGEFYKCSRAKGHGHLGLSEALAQSCNHAFLNLHSRVTPAEWVEFCQKSGLLGREALQKLDPQAQAGEFRAPSSPRDRYLLPLGYNLRVTAASVGVFFTSLFSEGRVRELLPETSRGSARDLARLALAPETKATIIEGMRLAAKEGTARGLDGLNLLAKTGSGLVENEIFRLDGWCVAALPAENPRLLLVSFVKESYGGGPPLKAIRSLVERLKYLGYRF